MMRFVLTALLTFTSANIQAGSCTVRSLRIDANEQGKVLAGCVQPSPPPSSTRSRAQ